MSQSVLFDEPGPRGRRNTRIATGVAILLIALLVVYVLRRLDDQEQLEPELWSPIFNPGDELFGTVWEVMGRAVLRNLQAAAVAMVLSVVIGTALALSRVSLPRIPRYGVIGFIELFRGIPVVIAVFFAARVLPEFGIDLPTLWYLVIGLTAYNSVVIAEIVRSGLSAVPRGQFEAAQAIGLTSGQGLRIIMLPQAIRIMLPALISQLVVVLKDTSLGFIIGFEELVRTAGRVGQELDNPLQAYLVAAIVFIIVNYLLGKLAEWVERRLSRSTATAAQADAAADAEAAPAAAGG